MNLFDPPKFPEPFKPEPLWQMNTCPTCQNDLVCHDQGECLRTTPETDAAWDAYYRGAAGLRYVRDKMESFERERNEARELLASEKSTRNAIIAKGIETERQLAEAREAFAIATDQLVHWIPHTPGDPMPCPGNTLVRALFRDGTKWLDPIAAFDLYWGNDNHKTDIIGWHPVEEAGDIEQAKLKAEREDWMRLAFDMLSLFKEDKDFVITQERVECWRAEWSRISGLDCNEHA